MRRAFLLAAPALVLPVAALLAAGQFDGAYRGQRTSLRGSPPDCTKEGATTLQVKDGVFRLTYGKAHFDTEVKADGSFEKTMQYNAGHFTVNATLTGHIANRALEADLETYACKYHYALQRK
jgi:hypothetical protein